MKKHQVLLLLFSILNVATLKAKVEIASIFNDNMVLQQQMDVNIWGTASPNKKVTIQPTWTSTVFSTTSDKNGKWKTKISTPEAGGPYHIKISDGEEKVLSNILIGEVWLCSGQSNMEMPIKGFKNQRVDGSLKAIVTSADTQIRLCQIKRIASDAPQESCESEGKTCGPESVANFSATGYFYAKMLRQVLGVPIGIIEADWGGSAIEAWMSNESLQSITQQLKTSKNIRKKPQIQHLPNKLFNGMIHLIIGYGIKGVIWWHGANNSRQYYNYELLFRTMVNDWRNRWGIGDFSFNLAQLAPYPFNNVMGYMREAQVNCARNTPNCDIAILLDISDSTFMHGPIKEVVGERFAYIALAQTYGMKGFEYTGPIYKSMEIKKDKIRIFFDHATEGLTSYGKKLTEFEIAGKDKVFHPATAEITKEGLYVSSPDVPQPVAVRYAFQSFVTGTLFNTAGLPASSFRTDDW